jgi:hypothetical protein
VGRTKGVVVSVPDLSIAVGDRQPPFTRTWVDEDGNEVDLAGFTVVFQMQDQGRANPVISGSVTPTLSPSGKLSVCSYPWGATDTLVAALYDAEFVATKTGAQMSFPGDRTFIIEIRPHV